MDEKIPSINEILDIVRQQLKESLFRAGFDDAEILSRVYATLAYGPICNCETCNLPDDEFPETLQ